MTLRELESLERLGAQLRCKAETFTEPAWDVATQCDGKVQLMESEDGTTTPLCFRCGFIEADQVWSDGPRKGKWIDG